jgi:hypothetical protein
MASLESKSHGWSPEDWVPATKRREGRYPVQVFAILPARNRLFLPARDFHFAAVRSLGIDGRRKF